MGEIGSSSNNNSSIDRSMMMMMMMMRRSWNGGVDLSYRIPMRHDGEYSISIDRSPHRSPVMREEGGKEGREEGSCSLTHSF